MEGGIGFEKPDFRDRRVQAFLSKFMSGDARIIYPVFDVKYGYRYPEVEEIVGGPLSDDEFLAGLFKAGILRRELYDKVIYCPHCGSADVSTRYCCPHCKSFKIEKSWLIEHLPCGYIDVEGRFKTGGKLVCPRCRVELAKTDVDYAKAGVWCDCNECGKSFDVPVPHHFCRECHRRSLFEEATIKNAYSYKLNQDAIKGVALDGTITAPIREFLEERGFKVENPAFLEGKSGVKHMFDIVARGKGIARNIVIIQLAHSSNDGLVSEQSVIDMFAKVYDSPSNRAFLIATPRINETGKKLAHLYKIGTIEAKDQNEALTALEKLIT
ncbi:MAG: hypothetical protein ACE5L6_05790 [Candidatus Bathyarchaeia archaeon]